MKKLLSVFLLLALTLTACKSAATAKPSEAPETQPATVQGCGSGEVCMLSAADGGYYYTSFTDGEVNRTDEIGRILIYAIDEATGTARPACNLLGCTHDSDDCPAHITGTATCYADGGEVYLYICQYKEAEDTTVFRLEKISADHTQRVCLADDLPFGWVQPTGMAADDSYLYFLTTNNYNDTTMSAMLLAVSKETGDRQTLYQMDSLENGRGSTGQVTFINLAGAHGRRYIFLVLKMPLPTQLLRNSSGVMTLLPSNAPKYRTAILTKIPLLCPITHLPATGAASAAVLLYAINKPARPLCWMPLPERAPYWPKISLPLFPGMGAIIVFSAIRTDGC